MRRINRRIFWAAACLLSIAAVQGCSRPESSAAGKTTISLAYSGGLLSRNIMQQVIDGFEKKEPAVKVKMEFMEGNYYEKLQIQVAGNTAPDVIWIQDIRLPAFAARGVFKDLGPFVQEDAEFRIDEYYPQALDIYRYQGTLYAIPQNCAPVMFQYNADLFEPAGLGPPGGDWTWDAFLETAKLLTKDTDGDGRVDQYGFTGGGSIHTMAMFIAQNGGRILDVDKRVCTITSPEAIEAVGFYIDLVRKYRVAPGQEETKDNPSWEMYYRGRIGMTQFISPWAPDALKHQGFSWDAVPAPRARKRSTVFFSDGFGISKGTKHPGQAWRFLKYAAGEQGQTIYCKAHKIFPTLKALAGSGVFLDPAVPPRNKEILLEAMDYADFLPIMPEFTEIDLKVISKEMDLAFLGNQSAEESCLRIKQGIEGLLKGQ